MFAVSSVRARAASADTSLTSRAYVFALMRFSVYGQPATAIGREILFGTDRFGRHAAVDPDHVLAVLCAVNRNGVRLAMNIDIPL